MHPVSFELLVRVGEWRGERIYLHTERNQNRVQDLVKSYEASANCHLGVITYFYLPTGDKPRRLRYIIEV